MTEPAQKPHRSKQDYGTPPALIAAVEKRWGKLWVDLAAREDNKKAPYFYSPEVDSLAQEWAQFTSGWTGNPLCWLNPPFENMGDWAAKCWAESIKGARIIMLSPASVGAEWFADYVWGNALVIGLRPRITFEGCKDPYPKDCMLTVWGIDPPGFETWRWRP